MTLPVTRKAYEDSFDVLDKALEDPKGIRIPFDTSAEATTYRMRLNNARKVDRNHNARIYEPGDPMHGESVYDTLQFTIRIGDDGTHFVYIEPRSKHIAEVESLTEIESED
jgi:hypothetical protein